MKLQAQTSNFAVQTPAQNIFQNFVLVLIYT